jgi:hypothetical protein
MERAHVLKLGCSAFDARSRASGVGFSMFFNFISNGDSSAHAKPESVSAKKLLAHGSDSCIVSPLTF